MRARWSCSLLVVRTLLIQLSSECGTGLASFYIHVMTVVASAVQLVSSSIEEWRGARMADSRANACCGRGRAAPRRRGSETRWRARYGRQVLPLEDRAAARSAIGPRVSAPAALHDGVDAHRVRPMHHAYVAEPSQAPASSDRREASRQCSLLTLQAQPE